MIFRATKPRFHLFGQGSGSLIARRIDVGMWGFFTKQIRIMKTVMHRAETRGHADHGWLDTRHSFSFASWYDPERVHFGALRVLNDDRVAPGRGFGMHPHEDMEIVSIPLEGDLEHKDSMGNVGVIREGDVQVMSAGSGVFHSEYNGNSDRELAFLQIWVIPRERGVAPRYGQVHLGDMDMRDRFAALIAPEGAGAPLWLHQDCWMSMGELGEGFRGEYALHGRGQGVYIFVLEGSLRVGGALLGERDALGVWDTEAVELVAEAGSKVLLIEVPMSLS